MFYNSIHKIFKATTSVNEMLRRLIYSNMNYLISLMCFFSWKVIIFTFVKCWWMPMWILIVLVQSCYITHFKFRSLGTTERGCLLWSIYCQNCFPERAVGDKNPLSSCLFSKQKTALERFSPLCAQWVSDYKFPFHWKHKNPNLLNQRKVLDPTSGP